MIELTTGIVFLLNSLYGSMGADADQAASSTASTTSAILQVDQIDRPVDAKEIEKYIREQFKDTPILVEVARCESTFMHFRKDGTVVRGNVDKADIGVMQINERYHLETSQKLGFDIHTVEGNVAYAKYLYEHQGAAPWKASSKCWRSTSDQLAQN